jgi:hypothetical protein
LAHILRFLPGQATRAYETAKCPGLPVPTA